jgi:glycosyltransferase involved in cell wall biosynthesis
MKISVVIPVYNEEKRIKNCLNSLMKQEKKPDEIIVVDNNCTDSTISIIKKFKGVKIIREKKQGMIQARNAGFNATFGDIIARCDADSILPVNWIKDIKKAFSKNNQIVGFTNPIVFCDLQIVNKSNLPSDVFYYVSKIILGFPSFVGPSMAITKKAWLKVKDELCNNDKDVHEDIDLAIHIKKYGEIFFEPNVVVQISGRRIKYNPTSFFIEYPLRLIKMLQSHRHLF